MNALVLRDVRDVVLVDMPQPEPRTDEIVVEVLLAGICGSDVHGYLGHSERRSSNLPLVMGHEIVGRVARAGAAVASSFGLGQRVVVQPMIACRACPTCRSGLSNVCPNMHIVGIERAGGFATHVAVPASHVIAVPDSLTDEQAAMVEPLAIEVRLYRECARPLLRSVLILGAGSQGLLAVQLARLSGIPQILVSDTLANRLEMARQAGATDTVDATDVDVAQRVLELTGHLGVELAIETAGASGARTTGLAALARGGTFAIVGLGQRETSIDFLDIVAHEKTIRGVYCYSDEDFARALELLVTSQIQVDHMLSVLPLAEGPAAFAALAGGEDQFVKVLLNPTHG